MKIVILAAGKGERLWPLTKNTPKPLLKLGKGNTLLEEQIERIAASGVVDEVVVVAGYLGEQIEAKVAGMSHDGLKLSTLYNPFYETTNNLVSLWLSRPLMNEDFMITNGDNLFDAGVFREFVEANRDGGIYLSVSRKDHFDDDDMKVSLDGEAVREVRKTIEPERTDAESPGLAMVVGERSRAVFSALLDQIVRDKEMLGTFWLEVFNRLYGDGVTVTPWFFEAAGRWREVDIHPDVSSLEKFLESAGGGE